MYVGGERNRWGCTRCRTGVARYHDEIAVAAAIASAATISAANATKNASTPTNSTVNRLSAEPAAAALPS